jgi:putative transposase
LDGCANLAVAELRFRRPILYCGLYTKPAAQNLLQQQAKFDRFIECYNHERPHQARNMKYPGELYKTSARPYQGLCDLEYPFHDRATIVTCCGRICFDGRKINLSQVFAGQTVGIREVSEKIWLVSFMHYDLGFLRQPNRAPGVSRNS